MENDRAVRRLTSDEGTLDALEKLEQECFSVPWSRTSFQNALNSALHTVFGIFDGEALVAYAVLFVFFGEGELQNIAVSAAFRRQGLGERLIGECIDCARSQNADTLFLEVRSGNEGAKALYEKVGFKVYGRRPRYYSRPREDALLYAKKL